MIQNIDVRFFSYCLDDNDEADICEVSESTFLDLNGEITYARHSVHVNGCKQVCLTIEPVCYPMQSEIELKEA